ncbi:hypothetical protein [Halorussus aquaticus]|uniref:Nucleoside phosphorylase domain-containing protein n=1 Tax=Halorussus aquaticus TaxID=2953748 RepID=A0ABD5Q800_9EURY|nr:hypothetical protein [Halorussus aquaticus]
MDEYDFGIIIPMLSEFKVFCDVFDTSNINQGLFEGQLREVHTSSDFRGVVHCVQEQGLSPALSATDDLYEKIGPSLDLLVNIGIAGGLDDDDVKIGDVVSGSHVYEIDRNEKYTSDDQNSSPIRRAGPKPYDMENRFKSATKKIRVDFDTISEWSSNVGSQLGTFGLSPADISPNGSDQFEPALTTGPIASSGSVVTDRGTIEDGMSDYIVSIDRNILVVDQESVAVIEQVKRNNAKFGRHVVPGVLRGISDFADSDKGTDEEGRQDYAMYSAASLFKYLLELGYLDDIFNKASSNERIPTPITPPAIKRAQKIASTLRGQVEGKFGVAHRSLEDPLESLPERLEEEMPTEDILLEIMVAFENQCLQSDISLTNGAASDVFSAALRDHRNMLYSLESNLKNQIPEEGREAAQLVKNMSDAHLRLKILETTTSRGAVGGTAIDSFSRRNWDMKEVPAGHFSRGDVVPLPSASQVVVLERFDAQSTTKHYEVVMEALNGRVAVEEGRSATARCEIPDGGHTSVSFNISEADSNERRKHRFDEAQYPWGDRDILQIDVYASPVPLSDFERDVQEVDGQWLLKRNIDHSTLHTALPGVDQEQGGISVPNI